MKVKVNRQLGSGQYSVSFDVGEFTPEEIEKMNKFGVPTINVKFMSQGSQKNGRIALTQLTSNLVAIFSDEADAVEYQSALLTSIKQAIDSVRMREDNFTGSEEVTL